MTRALLISYAFPPVGGAGVQRVLKLVKYLPACGIVPTVLTSNGKSVPVHDATLERDVPAGVEILRARSFEPGYAKKELAWNAKSATKKTLGVRLTRAAVDLARRVLVPDPQILWLPAASVAVARRLSSQRADDVVFISGPPFSQFLLAALARLRPGTAVVFDYRDEWTTTGAEYEMSSSPGVIKLLEGRLLAKAHVVTTATDEFKRKLLSRFPSLDEGRIVVIPNGYDPEDFPSELPSPPNDRFVVAYVGTVFRVTSARGFLAGLRLFHEREPELARHVETRFVGRIVPTELRYFEGCEALGVRRVGYLEHEAAIRELASSHLALCLLDDVEGAQRIYPAKIFEIMHLGRPVLALAPEGALSGLVRRCHAGEVVRPSDAPAVAEALARAVRRFLENPTAVAEPPIDVEQFDRRQQAREFASAFRMAMRLARGVRAAQRPTEKLRALGGFEARARVVLGEREDVRE